MKVSALAGLRPVEAGSIRLDGEEIAGRSPRAIIGRGMGYVPEDRHDEGIVPGLRPDGTWGAAKVHKDDPRMALGGATVPLG